MVTTKVKPKTPTLTELIDRFVARPELAPGTADYYQSLLSNFNWYAQHQGWPSEPELITRDHIREFLDYVATESYRWPGTRRCSLKKASTATIHHYGKVIKTLFNWAQGEEYTENNPSFRVRLGHPHYKQVEPYTDDEVRAMLDVCEYDIQHRYRFLGIRDKAIVSLLADTGLRISELGEIRLSDLDPRLGQVRVMGKGAKMRVVPINGEARKALKHYLTQARQQGGDELWKTDGGHPLSTYSIKVMIQRLKKRAGVTSGGGAHRLRHYFATRYLEAGGDLNTLRLLLGHNTLDMVLRYSRYVDIQKALIGHGEFSPLDRLMRGDNRNNHSDDDWGWRG